jgi:hypothetical protein
MIVTEQEASTKRCQEGFPASDGTTTSPIAPSHTTYTAGAPMMTSIGAGSAMTMHVAQQPTAPFNCIGSACMAWRWFDNLHDGAVITPRGYCGKAGRI